MEVYEIISANQQQPGFRTGVARANVNFLEPADSFREIKNGFIYRGVLQSRQGIAQFAPRLANQSRVYMIKSFIKTNGTTELLVADANYMYRYDVGSQTFVQIPFDATMGVYTGFNITDKAHYISGTAYPDKDNNSRFVFTGLGITPNAAGSAVFFYDVASGTIKDYTDTALTVNPNYVEFNDGTSDLPLIRAKHVLWFNERINFVCPNLNNVTYNQGWLFSAIRDAAGHGENFNFSGSGLEELDTSETIEGASILGNYMAMNLSGSNWILEKTTDVFNPYYPKRIPSVIGTNAPYSFAQWNSHIYSMGQDGVLAMNTNKSSRADNKIPFFTRDEVDQETFDYTFGGFDRINSQFLWTYLSDSEAYTTQDQVLAYNYEEDSWSTYDIPLTVIGYHEGEETLTWDQIEATTVGGEVINPGWATWDTTEDIWNKIGIGDKYKVTLAGDDKGYIYRLNADWDDKVAAITNITQASQAVLTIDSTNFQIGDIVSIENVVGMTEINNFDPETGEQLKPYYTVVAATATSITIDVDSTDFTAYDSGGLVSIPIFFETTTNPFNPFRAQGNRCFISTLEMLLNTNGGFVYIDVYANEESTPFITNVLLTPDNTIQQERQWVSMVIDHEADFFTFKIRQSSTAVGVKITSVRLHVDVGGVTDG